jgi:hypothetical protein
MKGKKTGGRTKGTPNKATAEAQEFCRELLEGEVYRRKLRQRLLAGKVAPAFEATLWHYAYGKPKESVEGAGQQELIIHWRDPVVEE